MLVLGADALRLAARLDSGGGTPSFGRGSVFTWPRKANGNSAAKAAARSRVRRERDIGSLGHIVLRLEFAVPRTARNTKA